MKSHKKETSKELRDKIMLEIALMYRENQKLPQKSEMVNLFVLWKDLKISYSEFIDVILALQEQEYLLYIPADSSSPKIHCKNEYVSQEFVELSNKGRAFPETYTDEKEAELKTNLKYPLHVQVLTIIMTLLLSSASLGLLWRLLKWFLSLFCS